MAYYMRLICYFIRASLQQELAYRANFAINLLYSMLNLVTGILGLWVLFGQVEQVQGWTFSSTLAILGVYLILSALRGLFIGPSLEALAGLDGDIWTGKFDFVLLHPANTQFLVSVRQWRLFALLDLLLGFCVIAAALVALGSGLTLAHLLTFSLMLTVGLIILYAVLLGFTALIFWNPGLLYTWVFNGIFQMARYPVDLYPNWLRFALTWIVPVGVMTTLPAEALTGALSTRAVNG